MGDTEGTPIEKLLDSNRPGCLIVVPNALRDRINSVLDAALEGLDEEAQGCREHFYKQLLLFFDEHGYVPEGTITKSEPSADAEEEGDG